MKPSKQETCDIQAFKPTPDMIEAGLSRSGFGAICFDPSLEAFFDHQTGAERITQIRGAGIAAIILGNLYCCADMIVVPDVWRLAIVLSTFIMTPGFGLFLILASRLQSTTREKMLGLSMIASPFVPITLFACSAHLWAAYVMGTVALILVCGNITFRLRFIWACWFTALTLVASLIAISTHKDLPTGLGAALLSQLVIAGIFSLIANYQLEKSMRRSFLLSLREEMRSDRLAHDKDVFAALSQVDALTGQPNRRAFDERLAALWSRYRRDRSHFALLMIDVDFFKQFNDRHGHLAGDACLGAIAEILAAACGSDKDFVARYGGEEFAILMQDAGAKDAAAMALRLRSAFAKAKLPHLGRVDGRMIVTVSIGGATSATDTYATAEDIVAAADNALYSAKKAGRDGAKIARPPMPLRLSA